MRRALPLSLFTAGVALFVLLTVAPVSAVGPSLLMFYGHGLTKPILVSPGNPSVTPTDYLWSPRTYAGRGATIPSNLEGRDYVSMAIFWGRVEDPSKLKPSDASQHGRIYLPTDTEPPAVVVTVPWMDEPQPVPVPTDLNQFVAGWKLTPEQTTALKKLVQLF